MERERMGFRRTEAVLYAMRIMMAWWQATMPAAWKATAAAKSLESAPRAATPDATANPCYGLNVVTLRGRGFSIALRPFKRVNTVGGIAPATPGTVVGQEARVPYKAEYVFYRAQD